MIETLTRQGTELSAGLDYYKPTMSRLAYQQDPNAQVTYTLHNRGSQRIIDYVDPKQLQANFDVLSGQG
ncbi:MAG TPA: hypothetical protein VMQ52_00640 [Candidatus Saccharimonadales bacterium]|jgi:hypothetical protein|nr:hypothetical protein [Candidatus Saccharimonadales bacterium]